MRILFVTNLHGFGDQRHVVISAVAPPAAEIFMRLWENLGKSPVFWFAWNSRGIPDPQVFIFSDVRLLVLQCSWFGYPLALP